ARRTPEPHFYFELPGSAEDAAARRFVEVRGTPVLAKVGNPDGSPRTLGFLFAGCILDRQEVDEMPLLHAEDHIELASPLVRPPVETTQTMMHAFPLHDWNDRIIGQLIVWNNSRELAELETRGEWHLIVLVAAAIALFAILFTSLSRS